MEFNANQPIWQQLVAEFTRRIVTRTWPAGTKTPSVRDLAVELGVNPNTVQKSLGELERVGLVFSDRTSGRYVTNDELVISQARRHQAQWYTQSFLAAVQGLGLSKIEVIDLIHLNFNEEEK